MKHRGTIAAFSLGTLAVLLGLSLFWIDASRTRSRIVGCMSRLASFGSSMGMYEMDNGSFPTNIADMADYCNNAMLFICPGSETPRPESLDIAVTTGWFDYIYIHWPDGTNTPPDFPIIYDRSMSHHNGRGISLLTVGDLQREKGDRLPWDEGAERLKRFAREHPEFDIPMPEGT